MITARYVQVARPGVIVSTIVDGLHAETVTFTADPTEHIGFTVKVARGPEQDALVMQTLALADVLAVSKP